MNFGSNRVQTNRVTSLNLLNSGTLVGLATAGLLRKPFKGEKTLMNSIEEVTPRTARASSRSKNTNKDLRRKLWCPQILQKIKGVKLEKSI